jgi:hypothetical protein
VEEVDYRVTPVRLGIVLRRKKDAEVPLFTEDAALVCEIADNRRGGGSLTRDERCCEEGGEKYDSGITSAQQEHQSF